MLADEFAQTISERRSVGPKQQTHNAPSDDVFVRAARSAPSHNPFFPCRFVKVVSREKLADVFESALPPEADQVLRDRARSKALKGAACIVIIGPKPTPEPAARHSRVPPASSSSVRNPRPIRLSLWTWKT